MRIFARRLYDGIGDTALPDRLIEVADGRIAAITPATRAPGDAIRADIVAPGFIDLQINGANDVQFNATPTPDALARIAAGARAGGTAHILPTFITAPGRAYETAMQAARDAIAAAVPGILGLHLEGPFLSPERPGIHPRSAIRTMEARDLELLCAPFPGPLLVTLAPECQAPGRIADLARAGVTVFAGHSAATGADIAAAAAEGLAGVTHLFNAMSQMSGREPGVVGAALASDRLFAGIIADGHHVARDNIRIAARAMPDRLCLVTDAMQTLAGTRDAFDLHGVPVRLSGGWLSGPDGTLAGAHLAMDEAVRYMVDQGIATRAAALRMAATVPARALGLGDDLGVIRTGARASLTLLDDGLHAAGVVVDGMRMD